MSSHLTLPALLLTLIMSAPAQAATSSESQSQEPSGPIVHEDFCPG